MIQIRNAHIFSNVKWNKPLKKLRNKKGTGDDDVPGDVLKLLEEVGLKIMMKLMYTIYETGEWLKDITEVTMIAFKKKPQATKCSDHHTINLIVCIAKVAAKILRRRFEKKIEMYSEKISLDLEEEKELGMQLGC